MMTEEDRRQLFAEQCRHLVAAASRLAYTLARCQDALPPLGKPLSAVPEERLERLDALAVRFARCQELMGTLLRSEAILLGLSFDDYPKLLDSLRKSGLRLSISEWQVLRELRNDVGHTYLGTDDEFIDFYGQVIRHAPSLVESACRIYDHALSELRFTGTELGPRPA